MYQKVDVLVLIFMYVKKGSFGFFFSLLFMFYHLFFSLKVDEASVDTSSSVESSN
jgi:hypothetical protein